MCKKGNHKGFTLLELLVAVAILAIMIIPVLNAFLTSVRVNTKARDKQRAAVAAGNVAEDLKGLNLQELLAGSMSDYDVTVDAGTGIYTITTQNATVDGKPFTVEATLDPNQQTTSADNSDPELFDEATDYNATRLAELHSVDASVDGIYLEDPVQNLTFAQRLNQTTATDASVYNGVVRNTSVVLEKDNNGRAKISVQTQYSRDSASQQTNRQKIYDSADGTVRNIFIFYYPMYNGSLQRIMEVFTIENRDLIPVNIYLVPQGAKQNKQCMTQIRCLEGVRTDAATTPVTRIRSGFEENSVQVRYLDESVTPTELQWSKAKRFDGVDAKDIVAYDDLVGHQEDAWVYRVTVNVYKGQGADKENESLTTLETTIQK